MDKNEKKWNNYSHFVPGKKRSIGEKGEDRVHTSFVDNTNIIAIADGISGSGPLSAVGADVITKVIASFLGKQFEIIWELPPEKLFTFLSKELGDIFFQVLNEVCKNEEYPEIVTNGKLNNNISRYRTTIVACAVCEDRMIFVKFGNGFAVICGETGAYLLSASINEGSGTADITLMADSTNSEFEIGRYFLPKNVWSIALFSDGAEYNKELYDKANHTLGGGYVHWLEHAVETEENFKEAVKEISNTNDYSQDDVSVAVMYDNSVKAVNKITKKSALRTLYQRSDIKNEINEAVKEQEITEQDGKTESVDERIEDKYNSNKTEDSAEQAIIKNELNEAIKEQNEKTKSIDEEIEEKNDSDKPKEDKRRTVTKLDADVKKKNMQSGVICKVMENIKMMSGIIQKIFVPKKIFKISSALIFIVIIFVLGYTSGFFSRDRVLNFISDIRRTPSISKDLEIEDTMMPEIIKGSETTTADDNNMKDLFIAVTDITEVSTVGTVRNTMILAGIVVPNNATNQSIIWSILDAGETDAIITMNSTLITKTAGTVKIRATIINGTNENTDYIKEFNITITEPFISVEDIKEVPLTATAGTPLQLGGTVHPSNATNQKISWTIISDRGTQANIVDGILNTAAAGIITVRATIEDGTETNDYTQNFQITVNSVPLIVSINNKKIGIGIGGTFEVKVEKNPDSVFNFNLSGLVPHGVSINSTSGIITIDETTISGTHSFTITATSNSDRITQEFTLIIVNDKYRVTNTNNNGLNVRPEPVQANQNFMCEALQGGSVIRIVLSEQGEETVVTDASNRKFIKVYCYGWSGEEQIGWVNQQYLEEVIN